MTKGEQSPWLLGGVGAPVVPPSWVANPTMTVAIRLKEKDGALQRHSMRLGDLAKPGPLRSSREVCRETAADLAAAARNADPEWASEGISVSPQVAAYQLGEMPLLTETWETLTRLNYSSDTRVEDLAGLPRSRFLDRPEDCLALLDLEIACTYWLASPRPGGLHPDTTSFATLEDAAAAFIRELIFVDGDRLDQRWIDLTLRRQSWGYRAATLDEIGKDLGVTRERARQVLKRLQDHATDRRWPLPLLLVQAVEEIQRNEFEDIPSVLQASGLVVDDDWTGEELADLLEWLGYASISAAMREQLKQQEIAGEARKAVDDELKSVAMHARSGMGVVDLRALEVQTGVDDQDRLVKAIRDRYARVFQSGDWILAGDKDDTTLESVAKRQLWVHSPLPASELYEGLKRVQRNRGYVALPPAETAIALLQASGSISLQGELVTGAGRPPEPGSISSWLVSILRQASGEVLHKELINRMAIEDRVNIASLGVYYLFNPILRQPVRGSGLVQLVGSTPGQADMDHAIQVAKVTRVTGDVSWQHAATGLCLEITLGSNFIASGVMTAPPGLPHAWPKDGSSISCVCSKSFNGRISLNDGGLLYGWSSLVHHVLLSHGGREGTNLTCLVEDSRLHVTQITQ